MHIYRSFCSRPLALLVLMATAGLVTADPGAASGAVSTYEHVRPPVRGASAVTAMLAQLDADSAADGFAASTFRHRNTVLPFRVLKPTATGRQRFPLVLMLHGSGGIGADNRAQLGMLARSWSLPAIAKQFPAFVIAPQFAARTANYARDRTDGGPSSRAGPALEAALALVEHYVKTEAVDPERIYVVGFSMGASAAWHAVTGRPGLFAAAVPFSGVAPERALAPGLAATPIFMVHGNADTTNSIASDRLMYAALQRAGGAVRFREVEGLDHNVPLDMLAATDWRTWLFGQRRRGSAIAAAAKVHH